MRLSLIVCKGCILCLDPIHNIVIFGVVENLISQNNIKPCCIFFCHLVGFLYSSYLVLADLVDLPEDNMLRAFCFRSKCAQHRTLLLGMSWSLTVNAS